MDGGVEDGNGSQDASVKSDSMDVSWNDDAGEACSCGPGLPLEGSPMSWGCFCSVQSCARTIADYVDLADGGRTLRSHVDKVIEYADCNLVMVQQHTYSDYAPPSEYIFNRTTERLVGAKVMFSDSHYTCPFPSPDGSNSVLRGYGYRSGDYPVPSTCQASACMGSACPSAIDAQ